MESTWSRMKRMIGIALPTSMAFLALGYSPMVMSAEYKFMGSDTLTDVINQALVNSGIQYSPATPAVDGLTYVNTGSGQGEKNLAQLSGQNNYQSIAPMSRNLNLAALTAIPQATPTSKNVIALDAAVIVSRAYTGRCKDVSAPLVDPGDPTLAAKDSILSLVLGGPDALVQGSAAACASAARLNAIATLASCGGVPELSHFYRRDDNSGTTDTMKERLQTGRFCNGRAPGNFNAAGSNMKNDDQDPIRSACVAADSTHAATKCTYYPTNVTCTAGDPAVNGVPCTQGFLVALSESDPGSTDHTVSIANRVKNDNFNTTMGFAGREAVRQPSQPTFGVTINTVNFSDRIVRMNQYMLARRLFLQRNASYMTTPLTGVQPRFDVESSFFTWSTNRCNMDPVVKQFGFITCLDDCTLEPSGPGNLCSLPAATAGSTPSAALPTGVACSSNICASTGAACTAGGTCPAPAGQPAGNACSVNADCASSNCVHGSNPLAGICG